MFAIASAPRIPGYQISRTPLTLSIQGMVTGPPVSSTTIVCGLAAATWLTNWSWLSGSDRLATSRPSVVGSLTNTIATSDAAASFAAAARSVPVSYSTLAFGAWPRIAFSGGDGCQTGPRPGTGLPPAASTWSEPPPESTPTSAWDPMTAIDFMVEAFRGNWRSEERRAGK